MGGGLVQIIGVINLPDNLNHSLAAYKRLLAELHDVVKKKVLHQRYIAAILNQLQDPLWEMFSTDHQMFITAHS